ncbi:hypothetical protein [Pedobacter cryoconitis]|uniref:AbiTii domain-containing protein n=1 Tax=Pedobacter cryoconitis TaxID=188932 RepID=UPI00161DBA8A|nr:hypothetical protein [Pedobacter cryoconitis]MBB5645741.1 hypothetical protein [Pedobacter cryoconitis]
MKLIGDIINELMDYATPISGALLKTKVLAARIHNKPLQEWVNGELNGYEESASLPDYRSTEGFPMGNYVNRNWKYTSSAISIAHLDKEQTENLTCIFMRDSISAVEKLTTQQGIKISLSSHKKYYLEQSIINLGNPHFQILNVHLEIPATFLTNILAVVRSRLLEFMLEIETQFGQETEIEDLKSKNAQVTHILHTTINNNGDGNVITSGSNNEISADITINKGNKEQLINNLEKHAVDQNDIKKLTAIIDNHISEQIDSYSNDVNNWIKNMLVKAVDGSWNVKISNAGFILSNIIGKYYGLC